MSKIIRTQKPSVLPFYAMALCAVLPVYKLWALLVALGGAAVAFGVAKKTCPPRVVEHEVPFHTGVEDVDQMLTDIQQKLDTLHALNEALPDPQLSAAMTRMEKAGRSIRQGKAGAPVCQLLSAGRRKRFAAVRKACKAGGAGRERRRYPRRGGAQRRLHCYGF